MRAEDRLGIGERAAPAASCGYWCIEIDAHGPVVHRAHPDVVAGDERDIRTGRRPAAACARIQREHLAQVRPCRPPAGSSYSISSNRTVRSEGKISMRRAAPARWPSVSHHQRAAASGSAPAASRPDLQTPAERSSRSMSVVRAGGSHGSVSVERLEDRVSACGKHPEFDMAVRVGQLVEAFGAPRRACAFRSARRDEGGDDVDLDLERDAEQAERQPLRLEQIGVFVG